MWFCSLFCVVSFEVRNWMIAFRWRMVNNSIRVKNIFRCEFQSTIAIQNEHVIHLNCCRWAVCSCYLCFFLFFFFFSALIIICVLCVMFMHGKYSMAIEFDQVKSFVLSKCDCGQIDFYCKSGVNSKLDFLLSIDERSIVCHCFLNSIIR